LGEVSAILNLLPGKVMIAGVLLLLGLASAGYVVYLARHDARQGVIADIQKSNMNAERKADEGSDDVARCYRRGGTWVRSRGLCDGAR
jgi:hypothetical protein